MGPITADTTSTHANLISQWYNRVLLSTFDKMTRFYQFAEKTTLPAGEGKTATWNRADRLALGYQLTEGVTPSNQALATTKVSALVKQYGGVVAFTDFADLTTITDLGRMAVERLGFQSAETIDTVIQQEIIGHTTPGSVVHYTKHSAGAYFTQTASAAGATLAAAKLAVSDIRDVAIGRLRAYDVPPIQGTDYVGITSPEVINTIEADSAWTNYHQYVEKGIDNIYSGEVGRIFGVRFFGTTLNRISAGSADRSNATQADGPSIGTDTALAHATMIFGKGWYGAVELDGNVKMYSATGSTKDDILNQRTLFGWKANFIAKVLNVSAGVVLWSGVGQTFTGCTASARAAAGLRIADPTTST